MSHSAECVANTQPYLPTIDPAESDGAGSCGRQLKGNKAATRSFGTFHSDADTAD